MSKNDHSSPAPPEVRIIRRYPNRRLYDTQNSAYISLADVKTLVLSFEPFVIQDSKSGADVTRSMLLQILLEAETAGVPLFSDAALAHLIRMYGMAPGADLRAWFEGQLGALTQFQQRWTGMSPSQSRPSDWLKPWVEHSQKWMSPWSASAATNSDAEQKPAKSSGHSPAERS